MNKDIIECMEGTVKRILLGMVVGGFFVVLLSSPTFDRGLSEQLVPEFWTPSLDQLKDKRHPTPSRRRPSS